MPPPLEWCSTAKALTVITDNLSKLGLADATKAAASAPAREVVLPGFNLFSKDSYAKACMWMVPAVTVGTDTILSAYEEYADRRLGRVPCPERVARQVVSPRAAATYLGAWRPAQAWWQPAAKMLAVAFSAGADLIEVDECSIRLELEGYPLHLDRDRMFCNTQGRYVKTSVWASDAELANISVPELKTSHPLAVALEQIEVPESLLWAANAILTFDPKFRLDEQNLTRLTRLRKRPSRSYAMAASPDAVTATSFLADALQSEAYGLMDYYQIAVPLVMSAKTFTRLMGNPWKHPERRPRDTTLKKVRDHLGAI